MDQQNKDFYIEIVNGQRLYVMTAEFHKKRGYCCGNKCKYCPYNPKHLKGNTKLDERI